MSKKLLALLLAMIMVIGSFTSVLADTKTDAEKPASEKEKVEDKKDEAKPEEKKDEAKPEEKTEEKKDEKKEEPAKDEALERAMDVLKKAEVIEGFKAGEEDFKAEKNVTRAEFAAMIVRANNLKLAAEAAKVTPTGFTDVPVTHWANGYIAIAKDQKYINGYPTGKFMPEGQITYQEMAKMLVCALGKGEVGDIWPTSYIVKAQSLGLLNGVTAPVFTEKATRGDVFKMLYNMMNSKEFGNRKILKAIVLENSRVEKLADDEITVEVIDVVQKADWADKSRDKKGNQYTYKLSKELMRDPEELLGKVVNITVDKNDTVLEIEKDNSYTYVEGAVQKVTSKKFKVAGKEYNVAFDERYNERDERIFRTYLNDNNYAYLDFVQKSESLKKLDFARVTVKNGKVIFVDAYKFDDIAPVAEVKDGEVYFLDDARNARITKAVDLKSRVVFKDAKGYAVADKKEIVKDDVMHFYNDYKNAIVRKDAKVQAKLIKTHLNSDGEWIVTKDAEYFLRKDNHFMPIYSLEGKNYFVVTKRSDLDSSRGDDVKILLGIDDSTQLVESAKPWNDGVNAVVKVTSFGEVRLLPSKEDVFWAKETRDTNYFNEDGYLNNKSLVENFNYGDIVYYAGNDKNEIAYMGTIYEAADYIADLKKASITDRHITSGINTYRYFGNLHAYALDDNNNIYQIKDIEAFRKDNKDNAKLKAAVLTEGSFANSLKRIKVDYFNFLSKSDTIASVVVFKHAAKRVNYDYHYAVVTDLFNDLTHVRFEEANGKEYIVKLTEKRTLSIGDIVNLGLDKATIDNKDRELEGYVKDVVIPVGKEKQVLTRDMKEGRNAYRLDGKLVYFYGGTTEFDRDLGGKVQVYMDGDYVEVIRYFRPGQTSTTDAVYLTNLGSPSRIVVEKGGHNYGYDTTPRTDYKVRYERPDGSFYDELLASGSIGYNAFTSGANSYVNGTVLLVLNNDNTVAEVIGLKKASELTADENKKTLEDAVKTVEDLGSQVYSSAEAGNEQNLFEAEVKAALAKKGLYNLTTPANGKVTIAVATSGNEFVTTITLVGFTPAKTETAKNSFKTNTAKDDNQALVEKLAKVLDGQVFEVTFTWDTTVTPHKAKDPVAADVKAELVNELKKTYTEGAGKDFEMSKLGVDQANIVKNADGTYTIKLTYDTSDTGEKEIKVTLNAKKEI